MNKLLCPVLLVLLLSSGFLSTASDETQCLTCHAQQVLDWRQSDHAHAMAPVSANKVLGNFDNQTLSVANHPVQFSQQDQQWLITIRDKTWQISHVFGHYPLQQYLVSTEKGKKQVLPFAWDSRTEEQGGQRWINLFDDVQTKADRLHWQQPLQNWNGMCADCHSTGLTRNYDEREDSFDTQWQNVHVSCQSCHSLAANHPVDALTNRQPPPKTERLWQRHNDAKIASLNEPGNATNTDTCFACHSLRAPLTDGFSPAHQYLDQFKPQWLFTPLYHADGQIKEEVYVYGSFLQSKMHAAGVTCIDCHQPHTGRIKLPNNQLCTQCHASEYYDARQHHQHDNNTGSLCVNCHMPQTTYMKVDARRDHSFSIPDLNFSRAMNTPLACRQCHQDKDHAWFGKKYQWKSEARAIDALYARWMQGAITRPQELLTLLQSKELSVIKRASALAFLPYTEAQIAPDRLVPFLRSEQPLLRLAATEALSNVDAEFKHTHLSALLTDELRVIRIAAAQALLSAPVPESAKPDFNKAFKELLRATQQQSWRGEGRVNLASIFQQRGAIQQAVEQLEQAVFIDPFYEIAYINLADIYRINSDEQKAQHWLQKGLAAVPDSGNLYYSLGLQQIRTGQRTAALQSLQKAQQLQPQNYQFIYALMLMYEELDMTQEKQALLDSIQ